jgi:hypothetical protein
MACLGLPPPLGGGVWKEDGQEHLPLPIELGFLLASRLDRGMEVTERLTPPTPCRVIPSLA